MWSLTWADLVIHSWFDVIALQMECLIAVMSSSSFNLVAVSNLGVLDHATLIQNQLELHHLFAVS
jgi:hypothetical protein